MKALSSTSRLGTLVTVVAISVAACGGASDGGANPAGDAGQAGVVLGTAPEVESAVVESTTTTSVAPATTVPPETTTTSVPDTTVPPTAPPATTVPGPDPTTASTAPLDNGTSGVPTGFRAIEDDSGELRVNVPAAWLATDGAPDGALRQLAAAPDLPAFLGGYAAPGMILITGPAAEPDSWMEGLSATLAVAETDGCTVSDTSEYSDGVYTGTEHLLACGSMSSVAHLIGGRNSSGDLFFLLAIVRPVDEPAVRNQIVQSFFID